MSARLRPRPFPNAPKHQLRNKQQWYGTLGADREPHGFGALVDPDYIYRGEMRNGVKAGWGRFEYEDGSVLEGLFVAGQISGLVQYRDAEEHTVLGTMRYPI
jgi:hypothetical protein